MDQFNQAPAPTKEEFDDLSSTVSSLSDSIATVPIAVSATNTNLNRMYCYRCGKIAIVYGLVSFSSTTSSISNLPENKTENYVPFSLIDSDGVANTFFNLNPNATSVSCSGLNTSKYYIAMCVYATA